MRPAARPRAGCSALLDCSGMLARRSDCSAKRDTACGRLADRVSIDRPLWARPELLDCEPEPASRSLCRCSGSTALMIRPLLLRGGGTNTVASTSFSSCKALPSSCRSFAFASSRCGPGLDATQTRHSRDCSEQLGHSRWLPSQPLQSRRFASKGCRQESQYAASLPPAVGLLAELSLPDSSSRAR